MYIEFDKIGLSYSKKEKIEVYYENTLVGNFEADLIIEDIVIVELKSVRRIIAAHEIQKRWILWWLYAEHISKLFNGYQ